MYIKITFYATGAKFEILICSIEEANSVFLQIIRKGPEHFVKLKSGTK
jgi:hypothetical protein